MPKNPSDVILEEIDKEMDKFADRIFELSQQRLVDDGKIDTATMFKTANINRKFLEKTIVYPALYSDIINYGRHPGSMPPVEPLIKWVSRKLGITDIKKAKNVAWSIAIEIKRRGLEGTFFLDQSIDQATAELKLQRVVSQ